MKFNSLPLRGAYLIEPTRHEDDRGLFARLFCEAEFAAHGLEMRFVQVNQSMSVRAGTLRGFHYQLPPAAEVKIIRCVKGALWDVIIDLRKGSPSFGKWFGTELNSRNQLMMYVPRGFAHALITLEENTEAFYLVSSFYTPAQERGLRWNDPAIDVVWPMQPVELSAKDRAWPDLDQQFHGLDLMAGLL